MSLESGLHFAKVCTRPTDDLDDPITAVSFAVGVSVTRFTLSIPQCDVEDFVDQSADWPDFHVKDIQTLATKISQRESAAVFKVARELFDSIYYANTPPYMRHLLDYNLCRLFFMLRVIEFVKTNKTECSVEMEIIDGVCLSMQAIRTGQNIILIGPTILIQDDRSSEERISDILDDKLPIFVGMCEHFCQRIFDKKQPFLYSPMQLKRTFFSRPAEVRENFQDKCNSVIRIIHMISNCDFLFDMIPIHHKYRIFATVCALDHCSKISNTEVTATVPIVRYVDGTRVGEMLTVEVYPSEAVIQIESDPTPTDRSVQIQVLDDGLRFVFHAILRTYFSSYSNYFFESVVVLRNWLNDSHRSLLIRSISAAETKASERLSRKVLRRLCRFIAKMTHSIECTIYRCETTSANQPLTTYGSFVDRPDSSDRMKNMAEHMAAISSDHVRRDRSVSYRAMDRNVSEYVRDTSSRYGERDAAEFTKDGADSRIAHPCSGEDLDWGKSCFAMPIRVNGVVWGVLELISENPHNYSNLIQSRIAEVSTILSPFLFSLTQRDGISNLINISTKGQADASERATRFSEYLQEMLLAKGVVCVRRSRLQDRASEFAVIGTSGLSNYCARNFEERFASEFERQIAGRRGSKIFSMKIGDRRFISSFKSFRPEISKELLGDTFASFSLSNDELDDNTNVRNEDVYLCLVYDKSIVEEEDWSQIFDHVSGTLFSIFRSLLSTEDWEIHLRNQLAHELRRISRALKQTSSKLESEITKVVRLKAQTGVKEFLSEELISTNAVDLDRHSRTVENFAEALEAARNRDIYREHPLLFLARQRVGRENPVLVELGSVYTDIFMGQSLAYDEKDIKVDCFPKQKVPGVLVHDWIIRDVLQSISDNVLRYAENDQELRVSVNQSNEALRVSISNIGPALVKEDQTRRHKEGHRGKYARLLYPDEGRGMGVFYARELMLIGKLNFSYTHEPIGKTVRKQDHDVPLGRHKFSLVFPGRTVIDV